MKYTVKQLAKKAKTSVRTLHYYDGIDLLKPKRILNNGYREYTETELVRLHQIMYFKELGFSLDEIKKILDDPDFKEENALKEQKELLTLEQKRIQNTIKTIDERINTLKGGENNMQTQTNTTEDQIDQYKQEARERWGHTVAYQQSQERWGQLSKVEKEKLKNESEMILNEISKLSSKEPTSDQVQDLIAQYHQHMNNFYDCSIEIFRNLGIMYVQDERFAQFYRDRDIEPEFMCDAIEYYCDKKERGG